MGIQSQNRNGSIKTMKKKGTQAKKKRMSHSRMVIGGALEFDHSKHCRLCVIYYTKGKAAAKKYKKGHHPKCPHRTKPPSTQRNKIERHVPSSTAAMLAAVSAQNKEQCSLKNASTFLDDNNGIGLCHVCHDLSQPIQQCTTINTTQWFRVPPILSYPILSYPILS